MTIEFENILFKEICKILNLPFKDIESINIKMQKEAIVIVEVEFLPNKKEFKIEEEPLKKIISKIRKYVIMES